MDKPPPSEGELIRRQVGQAPPAKDPLVRAWELRQALLAIGVRFPPPDPATHRRIVGRERQP